MRIGALRIHALAMLVLTSLYLVLELSFNARLLDVVGGLATPGEIEAIEKWGRVISGIALTLAIWGTVILPASYRIEIVRDNVVVLLIAVAVGSLVVAWTFERQLIDNLVDASSSDDRRISMHLRVASVAALRGTLPIGDLDLGSPYVRPPAAKAFLAIFPAFALSNPVIDRRLEPLMRDPRIIASVAGDPDLAPGPAVIWSQTFLPLFSGVKDKYNEGNQSYQQALSGITILQKEKWEQYITQLRSNGLTPVTARSYASTIIARLRNLSLDLPSDWDPSDQTSFYEAVSDRARRLAAATFAQQSQKTLGVPVPPNLQWNELCAQPSVKNQLRSSLSLPSDVNISCDMQYSDFRRDVYPFFIKQHAPELMQQLTDPKANFSDGEPLSAVGRVAFTSVIVPPIALLFSLVGALVHVFKVSNYASIVVLPRFPLRGAFVCIGVAVLAMAPFRYPNAITTSAGYKRLESAKSSDEPFGKIVSQGFRWVIQAQPYCYPINEAIRLEVFKGYKFDDFPDFLSEQRVQ